MAELVCPDSRNNGAIQFYSVAMSLPRTEKRQVHLLVIRVKKSVSCLW